MIQLYCTVKNDLASGATSKILFTRACQFKKIAQWGNARVTYYDANTIPPPAGSRVVAELRGTERIDCTTNEILAFSIGVVGVADGVDNQLSIRFYSMGNTTGSQGSV